MDFLHKDWEVVCDNTRTCRAAGYQDEFDDHGVSVLLTRKAEPGEPVTGKVLVGGFEHEALMERYASDFDLELRINGDSFGTLRINIKSLEGELTGKQVDALVKALTRDSHIEWVADKALPWRLSDKGAAAVLLKMDEFQGRIGTRGALVRKGASDETTVLPALPMPVVSLPLLPEVRPDDLRLVAEKPEALLEALRFSVGDGFCDILTEGERDTIELTVHRLTDNKLLVESPCWYAAYNAGVGVWIINDTPPYDPVMVTESASSVSEGVIYVASKGRGIGDCWSLESWTWNGKAFVHTESSTTGMCRGFAGGAWMLPTRVTEVRRAAAP